MSTRQKSDRISGLRTFAGQLIAKVLIYCCIISFLFTSQTNAQELLSRIFTGDIINDSGISAGVCWGDYDNDGHLDLFVANWNNQDNYLYHNNGDDTFSKIQTGEIVTDGGISSGPCWGDFDNDGYLDLFVANQQNQNNFLYRNNGDGAFTKIIEGDIVNDYGDSYSSAWGDYDNDGDGSFSKVTESIVVSDSAKSMSGTWGDFDNDGDLDLYVTTYVHDDLLYLNNGDASFTRVTNGLIVNLAGFSSGNAAGDFDNDGDLDLFLANWENQNNIMYRNNTIGKNWLKVKCVGASSNRSAVGTVVRITATSNGIQTLLMREITTNNGFRSQSGLDAHFGLADASIIESIKVNWPSGKEEQFTSVKVNQVITVEEGKGITKRDAPVVVARKQFIARTLQQTIQENDFETALNQYNDLKENHFEQYDFEEPQLNYLGYQMLGELKIDEAIAIFKLNAEVYPESANVYDSLSEAYTRIGDKKQAVKYSEKVVEILSNDSSVSENVREYFLNSAKYRLKNLK